MNIDYTDLALDAEGIPILTDLVPDDSIEHTTSSPPVTTTVPVRTPDDIARELLESDTVQQQLNQMANEFARDVRLQVEQTLAGSIDEAINKAMEQHSSKTYDHIRRQLNAVLPALISSALQKADLDD
jgi:L-lactate utilization protein LutC